MPPHDLAPLLITSLLVVCSAGVLIFRGPLGKAIARRIEGSAGADELLSARVVELEHRLADLEQERARVSDLEERVDFAERLIASGNDRHAGGAR